MKWVLAFTTFALLVPAAALGGNGPCTADKLKLCRELQGRRERHSLLPS